MFQSVTPLSRRIHSRALPNHGEAKISRSKLAEYALNPTHPEGQHKAHEFKRALGFDKSNWELLKQRILDELPYREAKFVVDLPIEGPNGNTAKVRTVWMFEPWEESPSLITTYVIDDKKK